MNSAPPSAPPSSPPPPTQQNSWSSASALSQQPTLVPTRTSTTTSKTIQLPSEAFRKAHKQFLRRLTVNEELNFKNITYSQLCHDMAQLQNEQERRKEMMHLSRIQAFLEGMNHLSKTIEVFLNASDCVAFVWGPIKFLLLVCLPLSSTDHANVVHRLPATMQIHLRRCWMLMRDWAKSFRIFQNTSPYLGTILIL